jgi:hypothetical protein
MNAGAPIDPPALVCAYPPFRKTGALGAVLFGDSAPSLAGGG